VLSIHQIKENPQRRVPSGPFFVPRDGPLHPWQKKLKKFQSWVWVFQKYFLCAMLLLGY